jgi:hypothetical protein
MREASVQGAIEPDRQDETEDRDSQKSGIDRDRPKLAGMQSSDLCIRRAIDEAFLSGYRDVIWISVGLAILSALSAQMIGPKDRLMRVR